MKKITAYLLTVLLMIAGIFSFSDTTAKAASASFSVSVDRSSAQVGETITVTVTFNTDVQAAANFSLAFDGSVISPNGSTTGLFENSAEGTSQSFSFTVVGSGSTAITASGSGATLGGNPGPLPIASGSASFSSAAVPPPTDPPTEPPTTVPPTTQPPTPETEPPTEPPVVPTAPQPSSDDASIAESIEESIRSSEAEAESIRNSIAASEAASREESIRAELEAEESTEEETLEETSETSEETSGEAINELETEQESIAVVALSSMLVDGKAKTIDGKSLEMAETLDGVALPEGYSLSTITLGSQTFEVAKGKNGIILYYLKDGENGDFYLYDDDENVFYPYVSIKSGSDVYVILKPGKNIKIPGNLKSAALSIDGKEVSAWQSEDNSDPSIYILFAADSKGQRGFYRYNDSDKTLTAYSTADTGTSVTSSSGISSNQNSMKSSGDDSLFTILKVLACVVAILIIALIVVLILRSRSNHADDYDDPDDDYDEEEIYEDDGLNDFDNPMVSENLSETSNHMRESSGVSTDTMDLFDVQDMDIDSMEKEKTPKVSPDSTDSMIDMEALSRALSDVKPDPSASSGKIMGNTQKLENINRELGKELDHPIHPSSDDDDDFDITKFDD